MGLLPSWCIRRDDTTGKNIKTFLDSLGDHIQAISLVDEDGNQLYVFPISDNDGSITTDFLAEHREGTFFEAGEHYGILALGVRTEDGRYRPLHIADDGSLAVSIGGGGAISVDIVDNVASAFDHGSNSSIGLVAAQLIVASVPATLGVEVKAANGNGAEVYVGNMDVTAATADATDGFELGPGESILVRVDNVNKIWAISTLAAQRVFWMVV